MAKLLNDAPGQAGASIEATQGCGGSVRDLPPGVPDINSVAPPLPPPCVRRAHGVPGCSGTRPQAGYGPLRRSPTVAAAAPRRTNDRAGGSPSLAGRVLEARRRP